MKVHEIINLINKAYPDFIQEEYDNTGSQIIFEDEIITGVYVCLDADEDIISDALDSGCNLIISHHPVIFKPLKKIISSDSRSKKIINLIDNRISLFTLHTNFDKIMFSYLSEVSGFGEGEILIKQGSINDEVLGYGSIVSLEQKTTLKVFLDKLKDNLQLDYVIYAGDLSSTIKTAAFINGSGGGSIEKIVNQIKPDCIITGDVGYHHAKYALENNVCVIDAGHFGTEIIFKKLLAECISGIINVNNEKINIVISASEKNPFKVYRNI